MLLANVDMKDDWRDLLLEASVGSLSILGDQQHTVKDMLSQLCSSNVALLFTRPDCSNLSSRPHYCQAFNAN